MVEAVEGVCKPATDSRTDLRSEQTPYPVCTHEEDAISALQVRAGVPPVPGSARFSGCR